MCWTPCSNWISTRSVSPPSRLFGRKLQTAASPTSRQTQCQRVVHCACPAFPLHLGRFIMFRRCILLLVALALVGTGCGSFVARRIAQAPNSYPTWFAPRARVELALGSNMLTAFPPQYLEIGPPAARMRYRVIEPADYHFKVSSTNWLDHGKPG